ncbi:MAG: signal recognition particle-docking protein FtsY [Chloroflexi bacterium]|nr:signal recognition particle-docking protein FtsY [Chloroflexota bacterium]|tara:strand:+ start:15013 stop:15933 length:921 start_codon:yes stop_codon:yes gene_type:complete
MFGIRKNPSKNKETFGKTKSFWNNKFSTFFTKNEIDENFWDKFEEMLITSDIGVKTAFYAIEKIREITQKNNIKTILEIKPIMREVLSDMFSSDDILYKNLDQNKSILLVVGVNGAGKTTSIAKIANSYSNTNKKVMLAAADTFRAGAIEQLKIWGKRLSIPVIHNKPSSDPGAVVYDAINSAKSKNIDLLIIDTAGRLHTTHNLMEELKKIYKICKSNEEYSVKVLLVLDSNTGQNGITQAKNFKSVVDCDGVFLTKLDGTAKGGIAISISSELDMPILFVGTGEKIDDISIFDKDIFLNEILKD